MIRTWKPAGADKQEGFQVSLCNEYLCKTYFENFQEVIRKNDNFNEISDKFTTYQQ